MKVLVLLLAALCFSAQAAAQESERDPGSNESKSVGARATDESQASSDLEGPETGSAVKSPPLIGSPPRPNADDPVVPAPAAAYRVKNLRPIDYVRPDANRRLNTYLREVAGPTALLSYAATAGLLTWRNTPKEWGTKPDGYAKRFANVAGKNLIRATTTYALDEALKVDSTFYLSRDRSPAARLRNSVFSAVTARNSRGKRVIGIPRLAGGFLSEVVSSVAWYPARYDHDHGLKGGAISVGINAGVNILREFILKR